MANELAENLFLVRSCLAVKLDSVHSCTETFFIFQEILRAKSDTGVSMKFDRRPMALPYPCGRRLEERRILCSRLASGMALFAPDSSGL
jgi:hypothetical protein